MMPRKLCIVLALVVFAPLHTTATEYYGEFIGKVVAEWLTDDPNDPYRAMQLLEDFAFKDQSSKHWTARKGAVINGASIPQWIWSLAGSPYTGRYRRASVIHDYYCDVKSEPWENVHKMFYYATLADGATKVQAKVFYTAVYMAGPRWKEVHYTNHQPRMVPLPSDIDYIELVQWKTEFKEEDFHEVSKWIQENDPSLDEIRSRASVLVKENVPADVIRDPNLGKKRR